MRVGERGSPSPRTGSRTRPTSARGGEGPQASSREWCAGSHPCAWGEGENIQDPAVALTSNPCVRGRGGWTHVVGNRYRVHPCAWGERDTLRSRGAAHREYNPCVWGRGV